MEIIIGLLLVVAGIWYIFFRDMSRNDKTATVTPQKEVKLEVAPVNLVAEAGPAKCGCGRSPTGFCVGLHKLSVDEWAVHADNPNKVVAVEAPKAVAKKPAAKKTAGTKPAAKKAAKTAKPKAAKKA